MAPTLYRVDRNDTIVHVNEAWNEFALANGAPNLVAAHVLRRPLWSFMVDATTRLLYRDMMTRARAGHRLSVPFRCDGPTVRRYMTLGIAPGDAGSVQFEAVLLRTEPQSAPLWDAAARRREPPIVACSWCKRVYVNGEWLAVEEAVGRLDLVGGTVPFVSHGICDSCSVAVLAAADDSSAPTEKT
jgi:hypothetical protein